MQAKSAERAFGYRPSDSHPCPAGTKSNRCYGRSSDSSRSPRLPGKNQWQRVRMNRFSRKRGTYSSEHCSGFSPDSLFILNEIIFSGTITFAKINLFFMFYLFCRLFNALIFHFFDWTPVWMKNYWNDEWRIVPRSVPTVETLCFMPWNNVFQVMKQSVSYGETKCFKRLKLSETPIHLINLTIATISLNLFFQ